ncbi:hypothetical protein FBU30_010818 [Linnemannia zychae]|nr:hypothetical protein FBU30_010818 [Linnemannia zychae]
MSSSIDIIVSRALPESWFLPANNIHFANESWTHFRDRSLMLPSHFKTEDTLNFLRSYGIPLKVYMYYFGNPNDKIYTNEGFVLFEKPKGTCHLNLPKEVKVGPGKPEIFSIIDTGIPNKSAATTSNILPNTLPTKKPQQQDVEGFTKIIRKRTGKKRFRRSKDSSMEGLESTSTPTPIIPIESTQQAVILIQQVIAPTQQDDAREEPTQMDPTDTVPNQQDEGAVYTSPSLYGTESIPPQSAQVEPHPSNRITRTISGLTNLQI